MSETGTYVGRRLDRYQVTALYAEGGMADVYRAVDTVTRQTVCLKVMKARMVGRRDLKERFQREGALMKRLRHPHIVRVFDVGMTPEERPYLVMEFIRGGNLEQFVNRRKQENLYPAPAWILRTMRQVVQALIVLHDEGVVHRDVKPANILMRSLDEAVLADMGIMSVRTATRLTMTGDVLGTAHYMSPEQVVDAANIDGRSDIYAVGVILYELLAGKRPFPGADQKEIMRMQQHEEPVPLAQACPHLAPQTVQLVMTCMKKDPAARYRDAGQLLGAVDRALAAELGERRRLLPVWWPYAALGTLALLLLLIGAAFWWSGGAAVPEPGAPTRMALVAAAATNTETAVPTATDPPPTNTPLPTATPTFTPTPTPTATPPPTSTPFPTPSPAPTDAPETTGLTGGGSCLPDPGPRWGGTLAVNYGDRLGCAVTAVQEPLAAYQMFQKGLMIWREDRDLVYVLAYDGPYEIFDVRSAQETYPNDYDNLKGAFGWVWNSFERVQQQLSTPDSAEHRATNFAVQEFQGGIIMYFLDNNANHYVLYADDRRWFTPFD